MFFAGGVATVVLCAIFILGLWVKKIMKRKGVPEEFEVENGFVGLNRDAVFLLLKCMNKDNLKIRSVVGMCETTVNWSKQPSFKQSRVGHQSITESLFHCYSSHIASLDVDGTHSTLFTRDVGLINKFEYVVGPEMKDGVIKIQFVSEGLGERCSGVTHMPHSLVSLLSHRGACGISDAGIIIGSTRIFREEMFSRDGRHEFVHELDLTDRGRRGGVLCFVVDGCVIQHTIHGIPKSVHFFWGLSVGLCLEVFFFQRLLRRSIIPPLECPTHSWD